LVLALIFGKNGTKKSRVLRMATEIRVARMQMQKGSAQPRHTRITRLQQNSHNGP
jgi:hypothetical protein